MFFTIVTATCNAQETLPRLLDLLARQTCRDFELISKTGCLKATPWLKPSMGIPHGSTAIAQQAA